MSKARHGLVGVALLLLTTVGSAQDWKGMARIGGRVADEEGRPLADASVRLDLAGRGGPQLRTDGQGRWAYLGLASGTWTVSVNAQGYASRRISVTLGPGANRPGLRVQLEPLPQDIDTDAVLLLGDAEQAYSTGRFAAAREAYAKLLLLRPDQASPLHLQIARCYKEEDDVPRELEHLEAAHAAAPDDADIVALLAMEAIEHGFVKRGLEALDSVEPAAIGRPEVFYNLGVVFRRRGEPEQAIAQFTHAVSLDPAFADGYLQRGLTCLGLELAEQARADFETALSLQPAPEVAEACRRALQELERRPPAVSGRVPEEDGPASR